MKYDQATKGIETLETFILTKEGNVQKIFTAGSLRRQRTATFLWKLPLGDDKEKPNKYYLKRWDGFLWTDLGEVAVAPDGTATVTGESGKLYRIADKDGKTFRRPFMFKKERRQPAKVVKY